jgi:hypothetical protein
MGLELELLDRDGGGGEAISREDEDITAVITSDNVGTFGRVIRKNKPT